MADSEERCFHCPSKKKNKKLEEQGKTAENSSSEFA